MIKVGDRLPNATFTVMGEGGPQPKTTDDIFKGKKGKGEGIGRWRLRGLFTPGERTGPLQGLFAVHVAPLRENHRAQRVLRDAARTAELDAVNNVCVFYGLGRRSGLRHGLKRIRRFGRRRLLLGKQRVRSNQQG